MNRILAPLAAVLIFASTLAAQPQLPAVDAAMRQAIAEKEIVGSVTLVATKDKIAHLGLNGVANVEANRPMKADTLFWIASMTKPVTGVALLMLQDEGKLNVSDSVAKYIPEFAALKTPSGQPANLTIRQVMTHVSGLGEASAAASDPARKLADLIPIYLAAPMQYEPGARWKYTQSGINVGARIVEIVSGQSFDAFLQQRLFGPLGMKDTTFYPSKEQIERLATGYMKNPSTGQLDPVATRRGVGTNDVPPYGHAGLYSTAPDYARFAQMLLSGGTLDGRRYLSPAALQLLTTPQTGYLPTGFFQTGGANFGANYGWGIGTCVIRTPHEGAAEVLSPGSFGHGGAWGTQAWIDPVKGVAYIMMVQRTNHPNSDGSSFRRAFQRAAAAELEK